MSRAWMPMYWADFIADTGHLNAAESGAYLMLIGHYWSKGSLPDDDQKLARISRMTPDEWASAKPTISEFFQLGWRHKRIDAEFLRAADKSAKASASANKRWMQTHSEGICERNANAMLPQSQSHILDTIVSNNKHSPSAIEILQETLSEATAKDLIAHRLAKKSKLTPRAARELVRQFIAFGEPEKAASEMMLRGWTGFKADWMDTYPNSAPSSNGKGGMASLLAKSMGLKNGRESSSVTQAVHVLPIDNGSQRGNVSDDGGQLSGNIIDLQPRYVG